MFLMGTQPSLCSFQFYDDRLVLRLECQCIHCFVAIFFAAYLMTVCPLLYCCFLFSFCMLLGVAHLG